MYKENIGNKDKWEQCKTHIFWGEIAPADHLVQIYENDEVVLDSLQGFTESGLEIGDSVIIIATNDHINALNSRLEKNNFDLKKLQSTHQYMPLNADEVLSKFMRNNWPDEALFMQM